MAVGGDTDNEHGLGIGILDRLVQEYEAGGRFSIGEPDTSNDDGMTGRQVLIA